MLGKTPNVACAANLSARHKGNTMTWYTNKSEGPKGVALPSEGGVFAAEMVWIEPGESVEIKGLAKGDVEALKMQGVVAGKDPLDHDGDGRKGGAV